MSPRVLLADHHRMVREGFRMLLEKAGIEVVAEAVDGHEAIQLARERHPDVSVLDVSMPRLNGIDAARKLLSGDSKAAIVLVAVHADTYQVVTAMRAGIRGYVIKTQAGSELVQGIREVALGGVYLSASVSGVLVSAYVSGGDVAADPLTVREREVLQLVTEGNTTKQVAEVLGLSVKTAESYRAHLMRKLGLRNTASLVRYAIRIGVIELAVECCCGLPLPILAHVGELFTARLVS